MLTPGKLVYDTTAGLKFYEFFERGLTGDGSYGFLGAGWGDGYHPAVSGGKVLFWAGGTWQWAEWADQWTADLGGPSLPVRKLGLWIVPRRRGWWLRDLAVAPPVLPDQFPNLSIPTWPWL